MVIKGSNVGIVPLHNGSRGVGFCYRKYPDDSDKLNLEI